MSWDSTFVMIRFPPFFEGPTQWQQTKYLPRSLRQFPSGRILRTLPFFAPLSLSPFFNPGLGVHTDLARDPPLGPPLSVSPFYFVLSYGTLSSVGTSRFMRQFFDMVYSVPSRFYIKENSPHFAFTPFFTGTLCFFDFPLQSNGNAGLVYGFLLWRVLDLVCAETCINSRVFFLLDWSLEKPTGSMFELRQAVSLIRETLLPSLFLLTVLRP